MDDRELIELKNRFQRVESLREEISFLHGWWDEDLAARPEISKRLDEVKAKLAEEGC